MRRVVFSLLTLLFVVTAMAHDKATIVNVGTFNVWGNRQRQSMVNKYKVGDKLLFPSDHCPVGAKIELRD